MTFFPAKILLFGEYNLLKNGEAVVMPYFKYKGFFNTLENCNTEFNNYLHQQLQQLVVFLKNQNFDFFDSQAFEKDVLSKKMFFDSNIPQGYGIGSSGALTAAVYHQYAQPVLNLNVLKTQLASIESYFHGSSSGIDPLISYVQKKIHICSNNNIQVIEKQLFEESPAQPAMHVFLVNTQITRQTAPLVQHFNEKYKQPDFANLFQTEIILPTNNAIHNLLNNENKYFIENLQQISTAQKKLLFEMIPPNLMPMWETGLKTKNYFLKLCGAGGGGFLLGFTQQKEATQKIFNSFKNNILEWLVCLCIIFFIPMKQGFAQTTANAQSNNLQLLIKELVQNHTQKDSTYSIAVGVIDSSNVYHFFYGNKDSTVNPSQFLTSNTLFHIGAITKIFTALLTLSLHNQNIININDKITQYLPDSISEQNPSLKNITIYQLLTHTSGLPREPYNKAFTIITPDNPYSNYTIKDLYNFLITYKVTIKQQKKPTFRYSHVGMGLLTHLLENATHQSYATLLQKQILTPLQLNNTTLQPTDNQLKNLCLGHNFNGTALPTLQYACMQGSEALFSTLNDLTQIVFCSIDTLNCPNLPTYIKKSIVQSQEFQCKTTVDYAKVGLGWYIVQRNKKSPQIVTHSGRTGGYSNFIALIPSTKTAVILLSNSSNIIDQLGLDILELINR